MGFDAFDSPQTASWLETQRLRGRFRAPRLALTETLAALTVLGAMAAIFLLGPRTPLQPLDTVLIALVFVAADRVSFPVGPVLTSASQLAFVPLLLVVPLGWAVPLVVLCRLVPALLRFVPAEWRRRYVKQPAPAPTLTALAARVADCAYCLGPVAVLLAFGQLGFRWGDWPIYALALLAQFAVDLISGVGRTWLAERIHPREVLPVVGWLYPVDLALTCAGLFVAATVSRRPGLVLLVVPVIGLFALFARERKARVETVMELSSTYQETAELLGDVLEDDDAPTGAHSRAVADLALRLAQKLALDPVATFNVRYGALLHDVGTISIPKTILLKPGPLDASEWAVMREHTVRGQEMLVRLGGSLIAVGEIVRHSHERWDGHGYPDGLLGEEIPLESRIIAAADAWHAMTSDRPYRRAGSIEVAAEEMARGAGRQFDPAVVAVLLLEVAPFYANLLGTHPPA